jgi:hypothetical protein
MLVKALKGRHSRLSAKASTSGYPTGFVSSPERRESHSADDKLSHSCGVRSPTRFAFRALKGRNSTAQGASGCECMLVKALKGRHTRLSARAQPLDVLG